MPFTSGPEPWDQTLGALGKLMAPKADNFARDYHYGAESRKALIESNKLQQGMAAGATATRMLQGAPANPTYVPGALDMPILAHPGAYAPPPTGPVLSTPAPQVQPQPALAQIPGMTGGMPPGAPAATMAQAVVPNAPALKPSVDGPIPSHWVQPTMPTEQAANTVAQMAQSPTVMPQRPPPGTPPTGTAGAVLPDTTGNGPFQAGSFLPRDGGRKYAPPAAADGTPSPVGFNPAQFINMLVQSGVPADQAQVQMRGMLANWVKNGQMALPLAEQLGAFMGVPDMRTQVLRNEGALATGAQTQAGETARNAATNAAANYRQQFGYRRAKAGRRDGPGEDRRRCRQRGLYLAQGHPGTARLRQHAGEYRGERGSDAGPDPGARPRDQYQRADRPGAGAATTHRQPEDPGDRRLRSPRTAPTKIRKMTQDQAQREGSSRRLPGTRPPGLVSWVPLIAPNPEEAQRRSDLRDLSRPEPKPSEPTWPNENNQNQTLINRTFADVMGPGKVAGRIWGPAAATIRLRHRRNWAQP